VHPVRFAASEGIVSDAGQPANAMHAEPCAGLTAKGEPALDRSSFIIRKNGRNPDDADTGAAIPS